MTSIGENNPNYEPRVPAGPKAQPEKLVDLLAAQTPGPISQDPSRESITNYLKSDLARKITWNTFTRFASDINLSKNVYPNKLSKQDLKEKIDEIILDESCLEKELYNLGTVRSMTVPIETLFLSQLQGFENIISNIKDGPALPGHNLNFSSECLRDEIRTRRFLQGIKQKISELEASKEADINIIDAGCGAIPVLGIYAALCSDRVKATLIELDRTSFIIASQFVRDLGLQDRVKVTCADAEVFVPEENTDLVISETMNTAFRNERLPHIVNNFHKYLGDDIPYIPAQVDLQLIKDGSPVSEPWIYKPGTRPMIMLKADSPLKESVTVRTKVHVTDSIILEPNHSDITADAEQFFPGQDISELSYLAGFDPVIPE